MKPSTTMNRDAVIGLNCWPVPLDDGRFAVLSRPDSRTLSGSRMDDGFVGDAPFQVMRQDDSVLVIGRKPPTNEDTRSTRSQQTADTRSPWVPTVSVSWGPYVIPSDASLPAATGGDIVWSVESQPDLTYYNPTYGVDHVFYLVITLDGTEYIATSVMAGDSGTQGETVTIDAAGDQIVAHAKLYTDSTRAVLVSEATYTYTQNNP